jgi:hypothetical protein
MMRFSLSIGDVKTAGRARFHRAIFAAISLIFFAATLSVRAQYCVEWIRRDDVGSPGPRGGHAMAYDGDRRITVLFGGDVSGDGEDTWFNDTWEYDGKQWTQITIDGPVPPRRSNHAMAYDAAQKVVLMAGGENIDGYLSDTWYYRGSGNGHGVWTQASDIPQVGFLPTPARSGHTITYDEELKMCVMIGGAVKVADNNDVNQEWTRAEVMVWNGVSWLAHPGGGTLPALGFAPTRAINGLARHAAAYDSDEHRIVIYNGWEGCYIQGGECNPDLDLPPEKRDPFPSHWVFGFVNGKLRPVLAFEEEKRDERESAAMVYDRLRKRFVIYGGYYRDVPGQFAKYEELIHSGDPETPYTRSEVLIGSGIQSGNVTRLGMVYDPHRAVTIWYGGAYGKNRLGETWELHTIRPEFLEQPPLGKQEVCEDRPFELKVTLVPQDPSFISQSVQWNKDGKPIPGATSPVFRIESVSTNDAGIYSCTAINRCGGERTSFDTQLVVNTNPRITDFDLTRRNRCPGDQMRFTVRAESTLPLHYQWRKNSIAINGATESILLLTNLVHGDTGEYDVIVSNDCGDVESGQAHLQVGVTILVQPNSTVGDVCKSAEFDVKADGVGTIEYRWRLDGVPLSGPYFHGSTTAQLVVQPLLYAHEGNYDVVVSDNCGPLNAVTSRVAALSIRPGPKWALRTTNGPPARAGATMAYDSVRHVSVLFGGYVLTNNQFTTFNDLWEWNGVRWLQRMTNSPTAGWTRDVAGYWRPTYAGNQPIGRTEHSMAYDSRRGRMVLFGGETFPEGFQTVLNDTWEWDGTKWYFRTTNGPSSRFTQSMAYDSFRGITVMYGGFGYNDGTALWEWDGNTWAGLNPEISPSKNYNQSESSMAYDSFRHGSFVGPLTDGFVDSYFWSWDGVHWANQTPNFGQQLSSVEQNTMVYDSYRRRVLLFGGRFYYGKNETLSWDGAGWTPVAESSSSLSVADLLDAPGLAQKLIAHSDPVSQLVWNKLSASAQQNISNGGAALETELAAGLNEVIGGASIFDAQAFRAVAFSEETAILKPLFLQGGDLIRFNRLLLEDAFSQAIARSLPIPSGRFGHAMAYDSLRHAAVVFGGANNPSPVSVVGNETWELLYIDAPLINEQPASQYRKTNEIAVFSVTAAGPGTLSYAWTKDGQFLKDSDRINGSETPTLTIRGVKATDAGSYRTIVSNDCNSTPSLPGILTLQPKLQIFNSSDLTTLVWSDPKAMLEQADNPSGPWTAVPGAASPFSPGGIGTAKFFRINNGQ